MAVRLLQGLLRRPASKTVQVAADPGDSGSARDFSMTESRTDTGAVCLRLAGDIDLTCWDSLRNRLVDVIDIDRVGHLVVDLDGVTFLDCSGIGALIAGYNAALALWLALAVVAVGALVLAQKRSRYAVGGSPT